MSIVSIQSYLKKSGLFFLLQHIQSQYILDDVKEIDFPAPSFNEVYHFIVFLVFLSIYCSNWFCGFIVLCSKEQRLKFLPETNIKKIFHCISIYMWLKSLIIFSSKSLIFFWLRLYFWCGCIEPEARIGLNEANALRL